MTPGSLENASLTIWTTHLTTLESRASEHEKYGNDLIAKVADPLKYYATKFEELRKRHADYAAKLEAERDSSYAELRKVKGKYDAACQELESKRKKTESSFDKAKAQSQYQQQLQDSNNVKNTYLIAVNVTNKLKERYYHEYVPELLNSLQDLAEFRTLRMNALWTTAAGLETTMLQNSQGLIDHLTQEITRNQPHLDTMMYIRHNLDSWQEPPDKVFEPSPVWHDDDIMVTDEPAKVYLRNVLNKSKGQLGDLRREVDKKKRDVETVKRVKNAIREGRENKDEVQVVSQIFDLQGDLHQTDRKRLTAEVETSTITSVIGDVTLGAKNHNFKAQTFKIPTNCDLCGERIWGLSAKGFDCRDCGYTCHNKCQMKVPAECPGELSKEERKKYKAERQAAAGSLLAPSGPPEHVAELPDLTRSNTMTSLSSGYAASARRSVSGSTITAHTPSPPEETPPEPSGPRPPATAAPKKPRIMAPPPTSYISELPAESVNGPAPSRAPEQKGKMLYGFEANGAGEISVPEGRDVVILEPDGKSSVSSNFSAIFHFQEQIRSETAHMSNQTDRAGSRSGSGTRKGWCPRRTSRSPRRRSRRRAQGRRLTTTGRALRTRTRGHRWGRRQQQQQRARRLPAPRGKDRRWRRGAGPRSSGTWSRSTGTRRRATRSTAWRRASASSSSRTTPATAGSRSRRAALPRASLPVTSRSL